MILRNRFKNAYAVEKGGEVLLVGDVTCHAASPGARRLLDALPREGEEALFLAELGRLGAAEPERTLGKLLGAGCLAPVRPATWRSALRSLLTPTLPLLPGRLQERFLGFIGSGADEGLLYKTTLSLALAGLAFSLPLLFLDWRSYEGFRSGGAGFLALILASVAVHELGHSILARLNGLGFRPIGFAVYLVYPVFYTNVSGVAELPLKRRLSVNLGGLAFQSAFAFLLALAFALSGEQTFLAAACYILYLLLFNLNPLISTDGYWCWKDLSDAYRDSPRLAYFRRAYDALAALFSFYLAYVAWQLLLNAAGYLGLFGLPRTVGGWQAAANVYVCLVLCKGLFDRVRLNLPRAFRAPVEHPFITANPG